VGIPLVGWLTDGDLVVYLLTRGVFVVKTPTCNPWAAVTEKEWLEKVSQVVPQIALFIFQSVCHTTVLDSIDFRCSHHHLRIQHPLSTECLYYSPKSARSAEQIRVPLMPLPNPWTLDKDCLKPDSFIFSSKSLCTLWPIQMTILRCSLRSTQLRRVSCFGSCAQLRPK